MREKKLSPEYCKNGKIRAYQCGICDRLDVDDVTDKRFCRAGFWPGCGGPGRVPGSVQTDYRCRTNWRTQINRPIRTERGVHHGKIQSESDFEQCVAGRRRRGGTTRPRPAESEIKKISVFDLVPSEDNFYSMREIEELKAAIEIAGKVLQNLTVVPLDGGKYKVIAGHRRRLASLALVERWKAAI